MFTMVMKGDGQEIDRRTFDMTRDGFSLLAMGFSGATALAFKIRYLAQYNAMEATIKNPLAGFAIPRNMTEALKLAVTQSVMRGIST